MSKCNTENFKFFQHKKCEFFPCHKGVKEDEFNCLFCFCPLYALGTNCGGNFKILENGCKDCEDCIIPHGSKGYAYICGKYDEIMELASKQSK